MKFIFLLVLGLIELAIRSQKIDPADEPAIRILFFLFCGVGALLFVISKVMLIKAMDNFKNKLIQEGYTINGDRVFKDGTDFRIQEQADSGFFEHKFELKEAKSLNLL